MGADGGPDPRIGRVRKVDWSKVTAMLEELPAGTDVFIGVFDQSVRSHIKAGRIVGVDPRKYDVWTESHNGSRTKHKLFMSRKP